MVPLRVGDLALGSALEVQRSCRCLLPRARRGPSLQRPRHPTPGHAPATTAHAGCGGYHTAPLPMRASVNFCQGLRRCGNVVATWRRLEPSSMRWKGLPALLVVLFACGGEEPVQLVAGALSAEFPQRVIVVRALWGEELVAAVPVGEDGAFLVPVPAGGAVRFRLMSDGSHAAGWIGDRVNAGFYELEVCRPEATPLDLGEIRFEPAQGLGDEGCRATFYELQACQEPGARERMRARRLRCGHRAARRSAGSLPRCWSVVRRRRLRTARRRRSSTGASRSMGVRRRAGSVAAFSSGWRTGWRVPVGSMTRRSRYRRRPSRWEAGAARDAAAARGGLAHLRTCGTGGWCAGAGGAASRAAGAAWDPAGRSNELRADPCGRPPDGRRHGARHRGRPRLP